LLVLSTINSQQSNDFIKHLPNASLISLDEEMTGIMLPPGMAGRPSKDDMPSDRYPAFKQIPERYSMIQLGICLFEAQPQDQAQPSSPSSTNVNNSNFIVVRLFVSGVLYIFCVEYPLDVSSCIPLTTLRYSFISLYTYSFFYRDVIILRSFHPPMPALREKSC
jgi:hypothetical protein